MSFFYHAYGLRLESELDFPELKKVTGSPDVHLGFSEVPQQLADSQHIGVGCQTALSSCLLIIPAGVGRLLITGGNRIAVDPIPDYDPDTLRLFLLSSAFGALLHQRGLLPLHASVIATSEGAIAFAGRSGAGKSTLAAEFYRRGFTVLADEICAIEDRAGQLTVHPSSPYIMLWKDALSGFALEPDRFRRVRPTLNKYFVPVSDRFVCAPIPLRALYILEPENSGDLNLTCIRAVKKLRALTMNTFRRQYVAGMGASGTHLDLVMKTAAIGKITSVCYGRREVPVGQLADRIQRDLLES